MADEGTLATTAQVIDAIGENASAEQVLEANTNIWILYAESDIYTYSGVDFVTQIGSVKPLLKQTLANIAAARAAFYGIQHNQNSWQLATSQSKLNVINKIWEDGRKQLLSIQDLSGIA